MSVPLYRVAGLADVPHGFLGRQGGVSTGVWASLNVGLGSADDPAAVTENRARAAAAVAPGHPLVTAYQVHGTAVATVREPWDDADRPHADALVTDRPGLLLGILTADCAPVLLADVQAGVVGAAHAGWRGAIAGIVEATVAAMEVLGAARDRIAAAVGPAIGFESYEVDDAFRARFVAADSTNAALFSPGRRAGHPHFDLPGYVLARVHAAGVRQAEALGHDTFAEPDAFYSFRRATLACEPDNGRQIALIAAPLRAIPV